MNAQLKKIGLTPGRAALVAVLGVALAVVWGPQLMKLVGHASQPAAVTSRQRPVLPTQSRVAATGAAAAAAAVPPASKPANEHKLVHVSLSDASSFDPFAAPAWSMAAERATPAAEQGSAVGSDQALAVAERFASLRQKGVAMIFVSATGQAAQVGDETLHVGDRIDGFEVIEIGPTGVLFEPAPTGENGEADGA